MTCGSPIDGEVPPTGIEVENAQALAPAGSLQKLIAAPDLEAQTMYAVPAESTATEGGSLLVAVPMFTGVLTARALEPNARAPMTMIVTSSEARRAIERIHGPISPSAAPPGHVAALSTMWGATLAPAGTGLAAELVVQSIEAITHGLVIHPHAQIAPEVYAAEAVTMLERYLTRSGA